MGWTPLKITETTSILSKAHNWKSFGSDEITKYLLNLLPDPHNCTTKIVKTITEKWKQTPDGLTTGIMYLLPASEDTYEQKNYRPITRFSTTYKTLTGILPEESHKIWKNTFCY